MDSPEAKETLTKSAFRPKKVRNKVMKQSIKHSLLFIFLSCVLATNAQGGSANYSSDKALLERLGKHFNKQLSENDVCIKRLEKSTKVIIIGFPGSDSKCNVNGVVVDSSYFETKDRGLSKNVLAALGWEKADRQEREKLAKLLVEQCFFAFYFGQKQTFAAVSTDDGGIKVIVSLEYPPGITSRNAPKTFLFDKNGGLLLSPNNF